MMCAIDEDRLDQPDLEPRGSPQRFRCWLESIPGTYAQYDGYVDVWSRSADVRELFRLAVAELRRTAFAERGESMWRMTGVDLQCDDGSASSLTRRPLLPPGKPS